MQHTAMSTCMLAQATDVSCYLGQDKRLCTQDAYAAVPRFVLLNLRCGVSLQLTVPDLTEPRSC